MLREYFANIILQDKCGRVVNAIFAGNFLKNGAVNFSMSVRSPMKTFIVDWIVFLSR